MARARGLLRDQHGAISIDWIEMSAGSIAIGVMAVFAILNGGSQTAPSSMPDRPFLTAEPASLVASDPSAGGAFPLTDGILLPVGSVVVHSEPGFTSFRTPDGGWVDAWSGSGSVVPAGAVLTSTETFTLEDGTGIPAATYSGIYTDAYSSAVGYSFKRPQDRS